MKLSDAIAQANNKVWAEVEVRRNPSDKTQWFLILRNHDVKPFILVDDDESPIVDGDLNSIVELVEKIGVKEFTVFL